MEHIREATRFIKSKTSVNPVTGIILGTGLGGLVDELEIIDEIDYDEIPSFPVSTVESHHGRLLFGNLEGKNVVVMQGRFHYYEGYTMQQVTLPVRVMKLLGIKNLLVSNAAGGLNEKFRISDLMIINDHINFFPEHPLHGKNFKELGTRFPDMSKVYNADYIKMAEDISKDIDIRVHKGIYIGSSGPTLETPA